MTIEGYVIGFLCALINIVNFDVSEKTDSWTYSNSIIALVILPVLLIFPIFSILFMGRYRGKLHSARMKQRFGELHEGYTINDYSTLFLWFLEYFRKASLCFVIILASTHLWLQMLNLIMMSIFIIIAEGYINARKSNFDRNMNLYNEAKLIFIMYHLILFSDFLPNPESQSQVGISCSATLVIGTLINMSVLFVVPLKIAKR